MHTGMFWFDNSQTPFPIKIQKGIEYFLKKYGKTPELILVHPSMLNNEIERIDVDDDGKKKINCSYRKENNELLTQVVKISIRPYQPVLPGHIWIGISDPFDK